MDNLLTPFVTIGTAIVGLAILAVIVSKNSNTANVIGAAAQGFAADIGAAVSPVTGGTFSNFGGFGGSYGFGH